MLIVDWVYQPLNNVHLKNSQLLAFIFTIRNFFDVVLNVLSRK